MSKWKRSDFYLLCKKSTRKVASPKKQSIAKSSNCILSLTRSAVKLAITADLVLLLAALGSLNIPGIVCTVLALNLLCGLYFKEESSHEKNLN